MQSGALLSVASPPRRDAAGAQQQHGPRHTALPHESGGSTPAASICLVVHNGLAWLPGCVQSVLDQDVQDFELLVVDCASNDGSRQWLEQCAAAEDRVRLLALTDNAGYARAQNINIAAARADFVLLINQDVELDRAFVATLIETLTWQPRTGSIQGLVARLRANGERSLEVDTTGLEMARDRRVTSRDQGRSAAALTRAAGPVWGVDGPVAGYRRTALESARVTTDDGRTEVLDEDFFMYKEDVDLAWRLRLLGWTACYEPAARAWHGRTADGPAGDGWRDITARNRATPAWIRALSWRNQRLMQIKNDDATAFLRDLPWIARRELLTAAYIAVADPPRLTALPGLLARVPAALRKRRDIRERARVRRRGGAER